MSKMEIQKSRKITAKLRFFPSLCLRFVVLKHEQAETNETLGIETRAESVYRESLKAWLEKSEVIDTRLRIRKFSGLRIPRFQTNYIKRTWIKSASSQIFRHDNFRAEPATFTIFMLDRIVRGNLCPEANFPGKGV